MYNRSDIPPEDLLPADEELPEPMPVPPGTRTAAMVESERFDKVMALLGRVARGESTEADRPVLEMLATVLRDSSEADDVGRR